MMSLLALLEKQHFVLKGNGLMTFDMTSEYDNILRSVERTEVTWADEVTRESTDIEYHVDKVVNLPLVDPLPIKCRFVGTSLMRVLIAFLLLELEWVIIWVRYYIYCTYPCFQVVEILIILFSIFKYTIIY